MRAAECEAKYAEYGATTESRAAALLLGLGVPTAQHDGPMSAVAPGWKLRVLLARALRRPGHPAAGRADQQPRHPQHPLARGRAERALEHDGDHLADRHFLSSVCTHMADVDYGNIRVYPGATTTTWRRRRSPRRSSRTPTRAKERIADLEDFVRRFRAHKAKARQATSRMKMIEKLRPEEVKPSSRQYPFIRFLVDPKEKLHRIAVEAKGLFYGKLELSIEAGEKVAIIGPNGVGKTTLLQNLIKGKWAEKARVGYWPQDSAEEFAADEPLTEWMGRWRRKDRGDDDQIVRATLGQPFTGDDAKKSVKVISGGEGQRMIIGKLVLDMPNVMLLDEPTNHLDMEAIESLNGALEKYTGTLVFVSHDREFVSSLATRIIELKPDGSHVDFAAATTSTWNAKARRCSRHEGHERYRGPPERRDGWRQRRAGVGVPARRLRQPVPEARGGAGGARGGRQGECHALAGRRLRRARPSLIRREPRERLPQGVKVGSALHGHAEERAPAGVPRDRAQRHRGDARRQPPWRDARWSCAVRCWKCALPRRRRSSTVTCTGRTAIRISFRLTVGGCYDRARRISQANT